MFHNIKKMKPHKQVIISVIIGFAVISFWRGVWGLMDVYLFPDNYPLSLVISIILGLGILIATKYTQKELM